MQFLKNKKAWTNFKRNETFENGAEPKEYPAMAYTTVASWGYERENVHFLYADDIFKLAMKFRAEIQP